MLGVVVGGGGGGGGSVNVCNCAYMYVCVCVCYCVKVLYAPRKVAIVDVKYIFPLFLLQAQSASGASEWSPAVSFTTAPSTPSPPSHLTTVSGWCVYMYIYNHTCSACCSLPPLCHFLLFPPHRSLPLPPLSPSLSLTHTHSPLQVSSTPSSLLVAWATPDCNGEPITGYCIELSGGHMTNHMIKVATTETQYTISDLKANTQYRFVLLTKVFY